jgi:hypothetical protein
LSAWLFKTFSMSQFSCILAEDVSRNGGSRILSNLADNFNRGPRELVHHMKINDEHFALRSPLIFHMYDIQAIV